jgi:rubrerythrin
LEALLRLTLNHVNLKRNLALRSIKGSGCMADLKAEPPGPVRSLSEFFALAHAMESDAVARYTQAAELLKQQGNDDLSDVFARLAEVERGHVDQVNAWAGHIPAKASLPWALPDTHDAPPEEVTQSRLLTPYRVLASAVRHEERAFALWTYVAAHAQTHVKEAAERMALEELEHVSILRRERRKAFHTEQQGATPTSMAMALDSLAALERRLDTFIEQHPETAVGRTFADGIVADGKRAADTLDGIAALEGRVLYLPALTVDKQEEPIAIAEYLVEAYLRLAETSQNPETLAAAQELAALAVYRLEILTTVAGDQHD